MEVLGSSFLTVLKNIKSRTNNDNKKLTMTSKKLLHFYSMTKKYNVDKHNIDTMHRCTIKHT